MKSKSRHVLDMRVLPVVLEVKAQSLHVVLAFQMPTGSPREIDGPGQGIYICSTSYTSTFICSILLFRNAIGMMHVFLACSQPCHYTRVRSRVQLETHMGLFSPF
jgi:hypothetical protein